MSYEKPRFRLLAQQIEQNEKIVGKKWTENGT